MLTIIIVTQHLNQPGALSSFTMGKTCAPSSTDSPVADDSQLTNVNDALARQEAMFLKMLDIQQKTFQSYIQAFMDSTNKRFDKFVSENVQTQAELRASLEFTQNEVTELKKQLSNVNITATQMSSLDAGLQKLSGTVDYLENQSRRSNLRIDGIAEIPGKTWAQTEAVRAKLVKELNIPEETTRNIAIERAHHVLEKIDQKGSTLMTTRRDLSTRGMSFSQNCGKHNSRERWRTYRLISW